MIAFRGRLTGILATLLLATMVATPARAQDAECAKCHAKLMTGKVVHGAVPMGCKTCHTAIDPSVVPHRSPGATGKALPADGTKSCTSCHERKLFEGKFVHAPIANGTCILCHDPHASDNLGLLRKAPVEQCLECHAEVTKGPHVVAGFSRSGHPLGEVVKGRQPEDPLRPGRPFYCASCHEPHRSDLPVLMRFSKGMGSCQKCHKM